MDCLNLQLGEIIKRRNHIIVDRVHVIVPFMSLRLQNHADLIFR